MEFLSAGLDFIPVVGQIKSGIELISGNDAITGEELDIIDKGFCVLGLVPFGKMGRAGKRIGKVINATGAVKTISPDQKVY